MVALFISIPLIGSRNAPNKVKTLKYEIETKFFLSFHTLYKEQEGNKGASTYNATLAYYSLNVISSTRLEEEMVGGTMYNFNMLSYLLRHDGHLSDHSLKIESCKTQTFQQFWGATIQVLS